MKDNIKNIMAQVLEISPQAISSSTTIDSISAWNSIAHLSLIKKLEKSYQFKFSLDEILELTSYEAIIKIVQKKLIIF